ncbi:SDR family NAD(P)-dependent oxidoreductase [Sinimarinibacterium flocculans]|uniref:SDR family NAD(P)-dependent oxidoreductase n=1 Tax=Sinimarinibacterium flocculans TaxID=985250 RepID=UPI00351871E8
MSMQKAVQHPILITGATSGLGRRVALELARNGIPVIVAGRRQDAVLQVCASISRLGARATPLVADLASLSTVRSALDDLGNVPLGGIVANAGINTMQDARSADGYEITFAVNVLSHQLLICRLAGQLVAGARIVVLSSGVHCPDNKLARRAGIPVPQWAPPHSLAIPDGTPPGSQGANGRQRYSTSKLANVLQARGMQKRLRRAGKDIDVFALDPGLMVDTELARELPLPLRAAFRLVGRVMTPFVDNMRLSTTTARHVVSLLAAREWRGRGFSYVDGDQVMSPSADALRDDLMEELWSGCAKLIALRSDETCLPLDSP